MEVIGEAKDERDGLDKDKPQGEQPTGALHVQDPPSLETPQSSIDEPASNTIESDHESHGTPTITIEPPLEPYAPALEPYTPQVDDEKSEETAQVTGAKLSPGELPHIEPASDLSPATATTPKLWLALSMALCFTITFLVYIYFIPRFTLYSNPPTGDQPFYLMDTLSLVQDGDLDLANNYDHSDFDKFYKYQPEGFIGMTAPYPLTPMLANTVRPNTEKYSFHLPGLSIWLVPAWIVGGLFSTPALPVYWPFTLVFMSLLGSLVALNAFLFAHETSGRLWIAWAVWLPIAFSAPNWIYSYLIFTELPVGLLLIYSFRRLALGWNANSWWRLLLVGLCIGFIPWLAWRCVPIAGVLALYAFIQWWRWKVGKSESLKVRRFNLPTFRLSDLPTLACLFAPLLVSAVLLLWYNFFMFGRAAPDNSVLEQGRVAIFYWPWTGVENLGKFITAAFGQFFDGTFGLFPYSPVYLLAVVGIIAMFKLGRKADRRLLLWMALISVPYLTVICSFYAWHGVWCPPNRYLATFAPLLAAPLATAVYSFSRSWLPGAIFGLVYVAATIFAVVPMAVWIFDARAMWPLSPSPAFLWLAEDQSSFWKVDLRTLNFQLGDFHLTFPWAVDFRTPDDLQHPWTSATLIGTALLIVFIFYLILTFQRVVRSKPHWPFARQGLAWLGVTALLGSSWFGMSYEYLKPKTTLTKQQVWELPKSLRELYGITYMDDKIYVASFIREGQGSVGALDLKTGKFDPINPKLGNTPLNFEHPSDIKAGPDKLLYVLNNGSVDSALFSMKPDGEIVQRFTLDQKTPIATGLYLGQDSSYYIADMLGGRILHFGKGGGPAIGVWGGEKGGFNNPSGVAVDASGVVYAAEMGFGYIQELSPTGEFVRKYDTRCRPVHALAQGDWIDVSCDSGQLVSINTKSDYMQLSRFDPITSKPNVARGLTLGPDDTLYMLNAEPDNNLIISYKIKH